MNKFIGATIFGAFITYFMPLILATTPKANPGSSSSVQDFDILANYVSAEEFKDQSEALDVVRDIVESVKRDPKILGNGIAGFRRTDIDEETDRKDLEGLIQQMAQCSTRRKRNCRCDRRKRIKRNNNENVKNEQNKNYAVFGIKAIGNGYRVVINWIAAGFGFILGCVGAVGGGTVGFLAGIIGSCAELICCCKRPMFTPFLGCVLCAGACFAVGMFCGAAIIEIPLTAGYALPAYKAGWKEIKEELGKKFDENF